MSPDALSAALAEIRKPEQAASEGPWRIVWDSCDCGDGYGCPHGSWPHALRTGRADTDRGASGPRDYDYEHSEVYALGEADAEFIVAARTHVPRLLAALDKVLKPHAPRSDRVLGSSCLTHRTSRNTMLPVPGCGNCVQDRQREVCPECRDEYGDPVLFQDCRARSAVLAALTGKGDGNG